LESILPIHQIWRELISLNARKAKRDREQAELTTGRSHEAIELCKSACSTSAKSPNARFEHSLELGTRIGLF
jgi:hypothetical protein